MLTQTGFRQIFWIGFSCALAGCSLALDPDEKQCKKTSDCVAPYECGAAGFCEKLSCKVDADCRQPGICNVDEGTCDKAACVISDDCLVDGELCNTVTKRCTKERDAVCVTSAECKAYEGAQVCRKSDDRCVEFECQKAEDCGTSPTVTCMKGACVDSTWGCLGEPDPRPAANMSSEGSLEVKVIHVFPATGELETGVRDLGVHICPFNDTRCATSVSDDWSYENNILTIRGLENGKNYAIQLTATHPIELDKPLIGADYQMYRTIVGKTVDVQPIVMFDDAFRTATANVAEVKYDPELGVVLAYVLDCEGKEVPGVSVGLDKITVGCGGDGACTTTSFYFTTANLPDPGSTQTSLAGRLGIVNMVPDVFNRLTLTRVADDEKLTSFVMTPRKNVITYTYFYPQDFGTSAD